MMNKTLVFDMDGTIADLYGVENWLPMLVAHDETPYAIAPPLVRLCTLARMLNRLQREGYKIAVVSWLAKHLPSVHWDNINIVEYGTPKENFCETPFDILFDDEEKNRENWNGIAFDVDNIMGILKTL